MIDPKRNSELAKDRLNSSDAFKVLNTAELKECPNCYRTFLPSALRSHLKSCTQSRPARGPSRNSMTHKEKGSD